jgi:hypothetical protein
MYVIGRDKYSLLPGPYNPKQARKPGVNTGKSAGGYIQFLTRKMNEVQQLKRTTKYNLICSIYNHSTINIVRNFKPQMCSMKENPEHAVQRRQAGAHLR